MSQPCGKPAGAENHVWSPFRTAIGSRHQFDSKHLLESLMLRRAVITVCLLMFAFVAGVPSQALAHGGHQHATQAEAIDVSGIDIAHVDKLDEKAEAALHSFSAADESSPIDDCHCPACHGCCHAPALSEAPGQFAPLSLFVHAGPREDGWLTRRWRSSIENPPKTFA
jgi:hypothetical protein